MAFNIQILGTTEKPSVRATGEEVRVIKPEDHEVIGLNMGGLLSRIEGGWGGGRPKAIYLRNEDLPWNDQSYGKYGLTEVQVRRRITSARIVEEVLRPYAALGIPARNNSGRKATVEVAANFSVTNSVSSSWNAEARVGASQTVSVEAGGDVYGGKVGISSTVSVEASYGQGGSESKDEQVGHSGSVSIELDPHTAAQAKLTASRGQIVVVIEYTTDWWGHIWVDYGRRVKLAGRGSNPSGHFFYFDPITSHVFGTRVDRQTIHIDQFGNYSVDIVDLPLEMKPGH